ncbi:MAG TPA: rhomboid family intramembrane serine protease [Acidobacteriaceae bacterium]|nr:rhomboid family intramembrane serine protease [Acidobacteriaceae bacterium]
MGDFRQRETEGHSAFSRSPALSRSMEPEILPPEGPGGGGGWYPPPDQQRYTQPPPRPRGPRRQVPGWAFAPATYVLCGINCAVYLAMFLSGVSFWDPTIRDLIHWGANNGTLVLGYGQWWRLITAMFVHVGIIHIATNIWCLWNLGLLAEPLMGPFGVAAAYLMTGFAGNLLSIAVHPGMPGGPHGVVGAGASGAIFGLAGVLIVLLKSPLLPLPKVELNRLRRSVIFFAFINLAIGLYTVVGPSPIRIDNMAHLGGFLSGLALGVPLVPKIGAAKPLFERRRRLGVWGGTFLLVLLAFAVRSFWG